MTIVNLATVVGLAAVAPLVAAALPGRLVPGIVVEIVTGLAVGPHALGWVEVDADVDTVALLGLAFLFFLAGLEIDLSAIRGRLLLSSLAGYGSGLLIAGVAAFALHAVGAVEAPGLVAVALSATGLGLVVPMLRDAGLMHTATGVTLVAAASVAEFSAVVALAVTFSSGHGPLLNVALLGLLVVLAVALAITGERLGAQSVVTATIDRLSGGTNQLRLRLSVAVVVGFAALAQAAGLEIVLGAFFAGGIVNVLDRGMKDPDFRGRLDGIGYGFLVPVFFITSGARLDLTALSWPAALLVVPLLALALLLARGLPAVLLPFTTRTATLGAGLVCATSLPFIVTASQLGLDQGRLTPGTAAGLTTAGLLGVCLFPALGIRVLSRSSQETNPTSWWREVTSSLGKIR